MKVKLLKRLRRIGRGMVSIISITRTGNTITGMSYSYSGKEYSDLFELGNTEEEVREKASKIYLQTNIELIRRKYRKYKRHSKQMK